MKFHAAGPAKWPCGRFACRSRIPRGTRWRQPGSNTNMTEQTQTETISVVSPWLSYQPRDLAQRLRDFYGMMPFDPAAAPSPPTAPPWLWAFTPVERGWVQFPVPNLAPPDPDDDAERIAALPSDVGGGAFTGFARFSNRQQGAEPIPTINGGAGDPPWRLPRSRQCVPRHLDAGRKGEIPSRGDPDRFRRAANVLPWARLDQRRCAGAAGGTPAAKRRTGQPRRHRLRHRRAERRRARPCFLARWRVDLEDRRPNPSANPKL